MFLLGPAWLLSSRGDDPSKTLTSPHCPSDLAQIKELLASSDEEEEVKSPKVEKSYVPKITGETFRLEVKRKEKKKNDIWKTEEAEGLPLVLSTAQVV